MTRDAMIAIAEREINEALDKLRNRMIGLVERAWCEGKKSAEMEQVTEIVRGAVAEIQKQLQPVQPVVVPQPVQPFGEPITAPTWPFPYNPANPTIIYDASKGNAPEAHFEEGDADGDNDN